MRNEKAIGLALEVLKEVFESRGLNVTMNGRHPFEVLNQVGALIGVHPGLVPPKPVVGRAASLG